MDCVSKKMKVAEIKSLIESLNFYGKIRGLNLFVGLLPILFLGVAIRVLLMPITLHQDLLAQISVAHFFSKEKVLNPYEHIFLLPKDHQFVANFNRVDDIFIYPPLTYFTLGLFQVVISVFTDFDFVGYVLENFSDLYSRPDLMILIPNLFVFKLPYLFIDFVCAFVLANCFSDIRKRRIALLLWMINPVTIYATFMIGQFDIIPTLFVLLSFYFARNQKYSFSIICLGLGGCYKMFPLLFVVPAAFLFGRNWLDRIRYLFLGVIPFSLSIFPFIFSQEFRQMALFAPKSQKMLFMNFPVTSAESLYPFIVFFTVLFFLIYFQNNLKKYPVYILSIYLLTFSVTHYHPQWFLWITPFLFWELVENNFKHWILVMTFIGSWVLITLFFEPSLSIGLFRPVWPELSRFSGFEPLLAPYFDVSQIKSIIRSIFAGAAMVYLYRLIRQERFT